MNRRSRMQQPKPLPFPPPTRIALAAAAFAVALLTYLFAPLGPYAGTGCERTFRLVMLPGVAAISAGVIVQAACTIGKRERLRKLEEEIDGSGQRPEVRCNVNYRA